MLATAEADATADEQSRASQAAAAQTQDSPARHRLRLPAGAAGRRAVLLAEAAARDSLIQVEDAWWVGSDLVVRVVHRDIERARGAIEEGGKPGRTRWRCSQIRSLRT